MKIRFPLALVSLAALALAACGGPPEESAAPEPMADPANQFTAPMDEPGDDGAPPEPGTGSADEATITPGDPVTPPVPDPVPLPSPAPVRPTPAPSPVSPIARAEPPAAFVTCGVCHAVEAGDNRIGPHLAGVVGRAAGSVAGFSYSSAMQGADLTWTEDTLVRYLDNPNAVVPGGSMPDPNVDTAQARAIVNYLKTL